MTWPVLAMALALSASPPTVVEKDGVRIEAAVMSHIYSWKVTNLGTEPITGFEIEYNGCYNHQAPEGWALEANSGVFRAWPGHVDAGIHPGGTETFTARTTSGGNALGTVTAQVTVGDDPHYTVVFEEVWGPVEKPRGLVALVAVIIGAVVVIHMLILIRRGQAEASVRRQ